MLLLLDCSLDYPKFLLGTGKADASDFEDGLVFQPQSASSAQMGSVALSNSNTSTSIVHARLREGKVAKAGYTLDRGKPPLRDSCVAYMLRPCNWRTALDGLLYPNW
jgi:hypothetical protein